MFYTGTQFPRTYQGGAFVAFHGSWNRAPLPMAGYNITFLPFAGGKPRARRGVRRRIHRQDADHVAQTTRPRGPAVSRWDPTGRSTSPRT